VRTSRIFAAFLRRDAAIALSYRAPFVLDTFAAAFNVVLFFYVGKLINPGRGSADVLTSGYFPFVLVGLALFGIAQVGLGSFATRLREEQLVGTLEILLSMPASASLLVLGTALFDLIRGVITALLTVAFGALLFDLHFTRDPWAIAASIVGLLATIVLFAAGGVLLGAFTVLYKQGRQLFAMAIVGTSLLCGVYYPRSVLPDWLQAVGSVIPITWALDLIRGCLINGEVSSIRLTAVIVTAAVGLPASLAVFRLAVQRAATRGTLAQY
jgi:ABC-2 type transport system permease protein